LCGEDAFRISPTDKIKDRCLEAIGVPRQLHPFDGVICFAQL
jgi:hypothetical protein